MLTDKPQIFVLESMNQQYHRLSQESENDVNRLQKILMAAPSYHLLIEGNPPGTDAALKALQELPPGKSEGDKYFFGIKKSGDYIGCFDLNPYGVYPSRTTLHNLRIKDIISIYKLLETSELTSLFSLKNWADDFADYVLFYHMVKFITPNP